MRALVVGLMATLALLSGCHNMSDAEESGGHKNQGRFSGIGIYDAGRLWAQMTVSGAPVDPAHASLTDDDYIIAVVDSQTGEVRQCGNHSGYCVTMNPWASASPPRLPMKLLKHASELDHVNETAVDNSKKSK